MPDEDDNPSLDSRYPARSKRFLQEQEAAYREEEEEIAQEEQEAERRANAIATMTEWFDSQFELPENETPREDGEYFFIWGGPFDASDVLFEKFSGEFDEAYILAAVEELQASGDYEWAPVTGGDYYQHPEPEEPTAGSISNRDEILGKIATLKLQLADLPTKPDKIGHNQPPEDVGTPPYSDDDIVEVARLLDETEQEISSAKPDNERLSRSKSKLLEFAELALKYAGSKADLMIDETIKWGVPFAAGYLVFGENLHSLIAAIGLFLGA